MSTPSPSPSPSVSLPAASETPMTQSNTVKTPSSQPSYRAIAPLHRIPPQQSIHPNPFPVRRSNPVAGSPHQPLQDHHPSALPFPGRGLPTRPGRQSPSTVADRAGGGPCGYRNGQGLDPMSRQFVRAQIQPASHLGSGLMNGVPYFLQPRVAHPPPTSILDNGGRRKDARNDVLVLIRKRKVRFTEKASLYSLCRSWLRNGAHEGGVQKQQSDANTMTCLPKPLLASDVVETSLPKDEPNRVQDKEDEDSVKQLSDSDLLKRHVDRAKKVRARLREERLKRIGRYKARLALLLPPFGEQ
ncbi:uncharacterized protein LOC108811670 isoform X2 [Raphanus sativus]|uniref:Uncharacterized protein LOC108811670 isoform X2 n=1 Tax=Raphanus sativus TaxID=3726 RepID=A0A6J0JW03_RAPSA|nr:uncharacterized protein LOC108811670 isoform X2 [Raphanus sativus]